MAYASITLLKVTSRVFFLLSEMPLYRKRGFADDYHNEIEMARLIARIPKVKTSDTMRIYVAFFVMALSICSTALDLANSKLRRVAFGSRGSIV